MTGIYISPGLTDHSFIKPGFLKIITKFGLATVHMHVNLTNFIPERIRSSKPQNYEFFNRINK
jgi:hypothetical protein